MGISDNFTCFLINLYSGQEATVESDMEQWTGSKLGKEHWQACILSQYLFNVYVVHLMWNAGQDESQAWIKITGRNINNLRYEDNTTLTAKSEEEWKSLLKKVQEEREKAGLKLNIQKMNIVASGPIILWQTEGNSGNSDRFSFLRLQNHCRQWLQPQN